MSNLDTVFDEVVRTHEEIVSYEKYKTLHYDKLSKLSFIAQIDHSTIYIFTVNNLKNPDTDTLYWPTDDELEYMYVNKKVQNSYSDYLLNSCSCWKLETDLARPTVMYICTKNGMFSRSPKENFAEAFDKHWNRYANTEIHGKITFWEEPDRVAFFFPDDPKQPIVKETWDKLKDIFLCTKTKKLNSFPNIDKKVYYDISTYWDHPLELNEEQYYQTEKYDIWDIPLANFKYVGLDRETEFVIGDNVGIPDGNNGMIGGVNYESIHFDYPQGLTREFKKSKDWRNYFCTIIKYINTTFLQGHEITQLYRQYFNNLWPIGEKRDPKYIIRITKFKGFFVIENEIWEHGLVYKLTNFKIYH